MQASSDIFLGWCHVTRGLDGQERDFYGRQLKDWKGSVEVEIMVPRGMEIYAQMCGWTLARAHARSGDRVAIAAYLGNSDSFDQATLGAVHAKALTVTEPVVVIQRRRHARPARRLTGCERQQERSRHQAHDCTIPAPRRVHIIRIG
jgi:hypothetical protein